MAGKTGCLYRGLEYSHGSKVCAHGKELECDDGVWVDTGSECSSSESLEEPVDEHFEFELPEMSEIAEKGYWADDQKFSRSPNARCGYLKSAGDEVPDFVNIGNACREPKQIEVIWAHSSGNVTLSYRLMARTGRRIRGRGLAAAISGEGDWDFSYGEDVSHRFVHETRNVDGFILHYFWNKTHKYVCFKIGIFKDGNRWGQSQGIAEPGKRLRVFGAMPDEGYIVFLEEARADPL